MRLLAMQLLALRLDVGGASATVPEFESGLHVYLEDLSTSRLFLVAHFCLRLRGARRIFRPAPLITLHGMLRNMS